ncbi:MAG: HDOD domain-containing protein [Pseudomonadota bacterium]
MSKEEIIVDDLEQWIERIQKTELPILNQTNQYITSAETYTNSHAWEIADAILHDPQMTSKLLRLANSVFFNTSNAKIKTVNKAVVYLGYDAVRSICFSTAIFDKVVSGKPNRRSLATIAHSIHAAVQAKMLADKRKEKHTEEVFIGALLYNIGELSFWCLDSPEAQDIEVFMEKGLSFKQAQKKVLGFEFTELTSALTKEWNICQCLSDLLDGGFGFESKTQSIPLGYDIVKQVNKGWNTSEGRKLLKTLEEYCRVKPETLQDEIKNNTREAESVIREFGVSEALEYIPGSDEHRKKLELEAKIPNKSDPKIQVEVLQKMSSSHKTKVDFNIVVQWVLEGLHQGVGLDRALIAIRNPSYRQLKGKFVIELEGTGLRDKFLFQYENRPGNLYDFLFKQNQIIWVGNDEFNLKNTTEVRALQDKLGAKDFLMAPLIAQGKCIGVVYADRFFNHYKIDDEDRQGFSLFVKQAEACLKEV